MEVQFEQIVPITKTDSKTKRTFGPFNVTVVYKGSVEHIKALAIEQGKVAWRSKNSKTILAGETPNLKMDLATIGVGNRSTIFKHVEVYIGGNLIGPMDFRSEEEYLERKAAIEAMGGELR